MTRVCAISVPAGFQIGYEKLLLAEASEQITLGSGTHYLLARNGRGKTTLLRTLAGSLRALKFRPEIVGEVQFVPEDLRYNDYVTAEVILRSLVPKVRLSACLAFAEKIELDVKKAYRDLSTGNKRKISWLMAEFSCVPEVGNVLLLDEPFTGLDSYVRECFMEYWEKNEEGVCRLVSCHPDFDSMAIHSAILISEGKLTAANSESGASWGQLKEALK